MNISILYNVRRWARNRRTNCFATSSFKLNFLTIPKVGKEIQTLERKHTPDAVEKCNIDRNNYENTYLPLESKTSYQIWLTETMEIDLLLLSQSFVSLNFGSSSHRYLHVEVGRFAEVFSKWKWIRNKIINTIIQMIHTAFFVYKIE